MIYILIAITLAVVDLMIKKYIEDNRELGEEQKILNGKITISKCYNKGIILNYFENKKEMVKTISFFVLGLILLLFTFMLPKKGNRLFKLGLSFVIGGAVSNVYDRMNRGYVVDYFSINCKKLKKLSNIVFNLGDIFIFIGSLLILLYSLFPLELKGSIHKPTE